MKIQSNVAKVFLLLFLFVFLFPGFIHSSQRATKAPVKGEGELKAGVVNSDQINKVSALLIPFVENRGQIKDKTVLNYANTFTGGIFVTDKGEIIYNFIKSEPQKKQHRNISGCDDTSIDKVSKITAVKETLVCPEKSIIKGSSTQATKVNYFKNSKENWITGIPTWKEVNLGEVYKGIEFNLRAYGKTMEKIFKVHPEASVEDIRLNLEGAKGLSINASGELEIGTEFGIVKMTGPIAYQEIEGKKVYVDAKYVIHPQQSESKHQDPVSGKMVHGSVLSYGFQVARYDESKPLVIDPLLASTFIGGSSTDSAFSVTVEPGTGDVFVTGYTYSGNYPVYPLTAPLPYDPVYNGSSDIFVSKFDSSLENLLASTFIGGIDMDEGSAITLSPDGKVYVTGNTRSSDYPSTTGLTYTRAYDVVVSKFSNDLSTLEASTMLGGFG
jgi:hypothetical protein